MAFKTLLCVLAGAAMWIDACAAAEQVDIPDGELALHATLYRPEGTGPFPAVIALHDCGGILQRPATNAERYGEWAKLLVAHGFVVLFPDSFGSRGLGPQCRVHDRKVRASRQRVGDANAARLWLEKQDFVRTDRISLLGWSDGGVAALWAVRPTTAPRDGSKDFRSAVVFYPSCQRLRLTAWSGRVPTLVLTGSADDWTPAASCQQMISGARGRSARAEIIVYPGAHHYFDRDNAPLRLRRGLSHTADPTGTAHGGTDPTARSDALERVVEWLAR